jgi:hypothetical protein
MRKKWIESWIAVEYCRLDIVEHWPDGPHKAAVLTGIRSQLRGLKSEALRLPSRDS